jgi:hypothetical protein
VTILDAVKQVPHRPDCAERTEYHEPDAEIDRPKYFACDCDRDERIAKGLEAAIGYLNPEKGKQGEPFAVMFAVQKFAVASAL